MSEKHIFESTFAPMGDKVVNALLESEYNTLEELAAASDEDLLAIKGIGQATLQNLQGFLAYAGHSADGIVFPDGIDDDSPDPAEVAETFNAEEDQDPPPEEGKKSLKDKAAELLDNIKDAASSPEKDEDPEEEEESAPEEEAQPPAIVDENTPKATMNISFVGYPREGDAAYHFIKNQPLTEDVCPPDLLKKMQANGEATPGKKKARKK
jgi:hypothetical protein